MLVLETVVTIRRAYFVQKKSGCASAANIVAAALLPITGDAKSGANIPQAFTATPAETMRDLRDLKRDQAISRRAWDILQAGGTGAYERALSELREDTRAYWQQCLADPPRDGLSYIAATEALLAWLDHHRKQWYEEPLAEFVAKLFAYLLILSTDPALSAINRADFNCRRRSAAACRRAARSRIHGMRML